MSALLWLAGCLGYSDVKTDVDGDGVDFGDCDDSDSSKYLNVDVYVDADGDGFGDKNTKTSACVGVANSEAIVDAGYALAVDVDGDGEDDFDQDDTDPTVYPGAPEICDDQDNDGNDEVDEGLTYNTWYRDADGDGYGDETQSVSSCHDSVAGYVTNNDDCDDADASVHETSTWYVDADLDGFGDDTAALSFCGDPGAGYSAIGGDVDDTDPTVYPGAPEICDGIDNDGNGLVDDGIGDLVFYVDADGDGYGDESTATFFCTDPGAGWVGIGGDCDDGDPELNPDTWWYADSDGDTFGDEVTAYQACSPVVVSDVRVAGDCDDNNASVHEYSSWYVDADLDGVGDETVSVSFCGDPGAGYSAVVGDAGHDDDATVYPGAPEICDGKDNNLDGSVDEGVTTTYYADVDGDGFGDPTTGVAACDAASSGLVNATTDNNDCDDNDASVHEYSSWYVDADLDGVGDETVSVSFCGDPGAGYSAVVGDAGHDDDATVYPGAPEICDEKDNNLDGTVDEGVTTTYYADVDGDGFGDPATGVAACDAASSGLANATTDNTDCNDANAAINPNTVWYRDADGDGFGDASTTATGCSAPVGYVAADVDGDGTNDFDFDDTDAALNPDTEFYIDADGDSYGSDSAAATTGFTTDPRTGAAGGYVTNNTDCNDGNADINPDALENYGSGSDDDCDGSYFPVVGQDVDTIAVTTLTGESAGDQAQTIASADSDGDGVSDYFAFGSPSARSLAGSAYIYQSLPSGTSSLSAATTIYGLFAGDGLGSAAAYVNDINGDGQHDLVIGAPGYNSAGTDKGAIYLFSSPFLSGSITSPSDYARTIWIGEADGDSAGAVLTASDEDWTGDATPDFVIASPYQGSADSGAVYLVSGTETGTIQLADAHAKLSGEDPADSAGDAVIADADFDGDGAKDLVIASTTSSSAASQAGKIYIKLASSVSSGTSSLSSADASHTGVVARDYAGTKLSAGDINGDGLDDLLVAASNADSGGADNGAVYILTDPLTSGSLSSATATVSGDSDSDNLGSGVAALQDLDGDGTDDFVVGVPGSDDCGTDAGAVHLLYGPFLGALSLSSYVQICGSSSGDAFGTTVKNVGDTDGDGLEDFMVASPGQDSGGSAAGALYLITGAAN